MVPPLSKQPVAEEDGAVPPPCRASHTLRGGRPDIEPGDSRRRPKGAKARVPGAR